ncbi:N-acetyl sugar amidotransferase [Halomicrobium sp. IBSBa]|uniref:N-acetyl sugar amidotransferase n=1 Tax=Halomicrobium sp. IBSBa TaxID=2778916 RepID=UPI002447A1BA|nr:N-acetyl sugar amidotransferase [Halomicrobium sp. IBSBa]MBO4248889.1 N-acetyl sugar amidotransferase [Halomicrobium sp. IBSBa]
MKRCTNCLMPTTKPGVELNDKELCQGCTHHEMRAENDYEERWAQLEELVDEYRCDDGGYDCIIPVSGGKDSHYQTYVLKEKLGMNPLLVAVSDPFTKTETGKHNVQNIQDAFDCDLITVDVSVDTVRKMVRTAFEELGSPTWPIDRAIYCVPLQMGIKFDIPLIIYGENTDWEYGGVVHDHDEEEPYSAKDQIKNQVAKPVDFSLWLDNGIEEDDLNLMEYPSPEEIDEAGLEPIYLSYFTPWDGYENYQIAKNYGFRTLHDEWDRAGFIEDYDQIDSIGYLMNVWMKYPKMGYYRTTDVVGYRRRSDHFDISIEEGIELIEEHDHKLDERILDDFLDFTGYSDREFWEIVESHRNEEIFTESFHQSGTVPRPVNDFENIDV